MSNPDLPENFRKVDKPCIHMQDVPWYAWNKQMVTFGSAEEMCWHCYQCQIHYDGEVSY